MARGTDGGGCFCFSHGGFAHASDLAVSKWVGWINEVSGVIGSNAKVYARCFLKSPELEIDK